MTANEKAKYLVNQYQMILMNEGYCENETLCKIISIKSAKITANEMIEHILKGADYGGYKVQYWKDVELAIDDMDK